MLQVRLWIAQGDLAAAQHWLNACARPGDGPLSYTHHSGHLMRARLCIAQARHAPGSTDLRAVKSNLYQLLQLAETDQRMADRLMLLVLLSLAHAAEGDITSALQILAAAVGLAAPAGYTRTFVDEGAPMQALLQALRGQLPALASDQRLAASVDRLLDSFPDTSGGFSAARTPALLSEREHAVLGLIAEGRSVAEIAARLVISAHTARTHVKNIYYKLEAHNRIQALERARALQLL
jgi:LuxR family maltose regulon positive regulatory protein